MNLQSIIRPAIRNMKAYSSARDEFQNTADDLVFLDANENPYSNNLNRYPDPQQRLLKHELAQLKTISTEQILIGNGSDEVLDLLIRACCEPNQDAILTMPPTYGMYNVLAHLNAVENQEVPLTSEFQMDTESVLNAIHSNTKLILICSPNNPSGNVLNYTAIEQILIQFKGLVIIDEAYIDFSSHPSWLSRLEEFPNLVITQTLSKAYGLAGIRLGICYASSKIISVLNKIKPPYNINTLTQSSALNGILNQNILKRQIEVILAERDILIHKLGQFHFVKTVFPSDSNFVLVRVDDANLRYSQLIQNGIIVRNRHGQLHCDNCLRITVGTPEENLKLIQILNNL